MIELYMNAMDMIELHINDMVLLSLDLLISSLFIKKYFLSILCNYSGEWICLSQLYKGKKVTTRKLY